jgi:hypothetical protein
MSTELSQKIFRKFRIVKDSQQLLLPIPANSTNLAAGLIIIKKATSSKRAKLAFKKKTSQTWFCCIYLPCVNANESTSIFLEQSEEPLTKWNSQTYHHKRHFLCWCCHCLQSRCIRKVINFAHCVLPKPIFLHDGTIAWVMVELAGTCTSTSQVSVRRMPCGEQSRHWNWESSLSVS